MRLLRIAVLSTGVLSAILCAYAQGQETPAIPANKEAQVNESKGMPPRATPTDYQAQGKAGTVTIAAEFMGHAVPTPGLYLTTEDYVVVETGLFGPPDARLQVSFEDFSLRINGKKTPVTSQSYVAVAHSLKDPEWQPPDAPDTKKGGTGISTNGKGGQSDSSLPVVIHVPVPLQRTWTQHAQKASLPGGDRTLPVAGLLFFLYRGRTQSIHSLELIYTGPAGTATLTLNP